MLYYTSEDNTYLFAPNIITCSHVAALGKLAL